MTHTLCEQVLARVLDYLRGCGVNIDRDVSVKALRIVEAALSEGEPDPMAYVMDQIEQHFELQPVPLPPAFPPLNRGSIGYDAY